MTQGCKITLVEQLLTRLTVWNKQANPQSSSNMLATVTSADKGIRQTPKSSSLCLSAREIGKLYILINKFLPWESGRLPMDAV